MRGIVETAAGTGEDPFITFWRIREAALEVAGSPRLSARSSGRDAARRGPRPPRPPRLTEPWFCCAEPTEEQFQPLAEAAV
ncbi:MAG: hypothetical protein HY702_03265 [Gemmatimonadetes bacterium]|nr:hypothetical protein [Gemmatimonadota bacterium]